MVPAARPSAGPENSKIRQTRAILRDRPLRTLPSVARLLVVEDDAAISEPLVRALAREGHDVEHVATGAAALDRVETGGVDLLVPDPRLPGVDGGGGGRPPRGGPPPLRSLLLPAR